MSKNKKKIPKPIKQLLTRNRPPRAGFNGFFYYEICSEAVAKVKDMRIRLGKANRRVTNGRVILSRLKNPKMRIDIHKQESIAITFGAMCLESCIWDYAVCGFPSNNYVEDYFENLRLTSKWLVIPQLLCGSDITKVRVGSTCLLGMLGDLVRERNKLVHSKSKEWSDDIKELKKQLLPKRRISAENAFGLIRLLLVELEKVDKTKWWFFGAAEYKHSIKTS